LLKAAFEGTPAEHDIQNDFLKVLLSSRFKDLLALVGLASQAADMLAYFGLPDKFQQALAKAFYIIHKQELKTPGNVDWGFSIDELMKHNLLRDDLVTAIAFPQVKINLKNYRINSTEGIEKLIKSKKIKKINVAGIDLTQNKLDALSADFIKFLAILKNLEFLSFAANRLTTLPDDLSTSTLKIAYLIFSCNQLICLPAFLANANLKELMFAKNKLTTLPANFLANSPLIREAASSGNLIPLSVVQTLPAQVQNAITAGDKKYKEVLEKQRESTGPLSMHDLIYLDKLRDDVIQELPDGKVVLNLNNYVIPFTYGIEELIARKGVPLDKISAISLCYNGLTEITIGLRAFLGKLQNLEELNLSFNFLESLPLGFLANMPNLKRVLLNNNKLASLPLYFLANSSNIDCLVLIGNPIPEEDIQKLSPELQKAILAGNGYFDKVIGPKLGNLKITKS
jgi:hypothetical protein